jgi:hypothetical protein
LGMMTEIVQIIVVVCALIEYIGLNSPISMVF